MNIPNKIDNPHNNRHAMVKQPETLTKAELTDRLCDDYHLAKRDAKALVESFFDEIRESLQQGESVKISGFGNFDLRHKRERPGRNPKTGEIVPVSARRVVTFKAGQKLRARVENAHNNQ